MLMCGERVNPKSEEIKRVVWRERGCGNDFVDGNLQCRRSQVNKREAEESVEFLQEQGTQRTRISCKRKTYTDIVTWPKTWLQSPETSTLAIGRERRPRKYMEVHWQFRIRQAELVETLDSEKYSLPSTHSPKHRAQHVHFDHLETKRNS